MTNGITLLIKPQVKHKKTVFVGVGGSVIIIIAILNCVLSEI